MGIRGGDGCEKTEKSLKDFEKWAGSDAEGGKTFFTVAFVLVISNSLLINVLWILGLSTNGHLGLAKSCF